MNKLLCIQEVLNSKWKDRLQKTFEDNLISAFLHGNCLMEGFNALEAPWTISFILRKNGSEEIRSIQDLTKDARKENIQFCYFFNPSEIINSLDTFPLEYLHIANKNVTLCGIPPLAGYLPERKALRLQCERELRGIMINLRQELANIKQGVSLKNFCGRATEALLPILYGVYFLQTGTYPEKHQQIFDRYPILKENPKPNSILQHINLYIETITSIINSVDSME